MKVEPTPEEKPRTRCKVCRLPLAPGIPQCPEASEVPGLALRPTHPETPARVKREVRAEYGETGQLTMAGEWANEVRAEKRGAT